MKGTAPLPAGHARISIEQGIERGLAQGVQRGEARILRSLLRLRFGELPDAVHHRLDTADADTLLGWSARVLTAPTLAAVFDEVGSE